MAIVRPSGSEVERFDDDTAVEAVNQNRRGRPIKANQIGRPIKANQIGASHSSGSESGENKFRPEV